MQVVERFACDALVGRGPEDVQPFGDHEQFFGLEQVQDGGGDQRRKGHDQIVPGK